MATEKVRSRGKLVPKALVYMLDAARADVLEAVDSPVWRKLKENRWAEGYRAAWSVAAEVEPFAETNSGPNHVTIATGMLLRSHHIACNDNIWAFNEAATPTWLERLGRKFPEMRTAFAFSWLPDLAMAAEHGIHSIVCGTDENNNAAAAALLRRPDPPSALMIYDDAPDHTGHEYGFYPYSDEYLNAVESCMMRLDNLLDTIRTRPAFAEEDWLIVICADHGGMGFRHGVAGGQASTVPLLYCGRSIPAGELAGRPGIVDIAAQLIRHFGLDDEVAELDGQAPLVVVPARPARPLADKLVYDLSVVNRQIVNTAGNATVTAHGEVATDGIDTSRGFVALDALGPDTGSEFTFSLKFKGVFSAVEGRQAIFGNRDCAKTMLPGFALMAEKGVYWPMTMGRHRLTFHAGCRNAPRNYITPKTDRMDLGDVLVGDDEETVLAVSIDPAGMISVYQRSCDSGRSYWFCADGTGIRPVSPLPWHLGQDGTGKYKIPAAMKISNFRFWSRALTLDELRKL